MIKQVTLPKLDRTLSAKDRDKLVLQLSANIQTVLSLATDVEMIDGVAWYANARGFAQTLARRFNLSLDTVAATIAALSPNCGWTRNKLDTVTVLLAHSDGKQASDIKVSTYNNNKAKAFAILNAARGIPDGTPHAFAFCPFDYLGGLKTRAFAENIACADSCAVTIDFHAASLARGVRVTTANSKGMTAKQYALFVDAYRHVAHVTGLQPYELQAITWCVWRRLHNVHVMHG